MPVSAPAHRASEGVYGILRILPFCAFCAFCAFFPVVQLWLGPHSVASLSCLAEWTNISRQALPPSFTRALYLRSQAPVISGAQMDKSSVRYPVCALHASPLPWSVSSKLCHATGPRTRAAGREAARVAGEAQAAVRAAARVAEGACTRAQQSAG